MAEPSSSVPLRIAIGHGSSAGEFVVRVLESPGGARPAATVRADLDALAIRRDADVGAALFETFFGGGIAAEFRAAVAAAATRSADLRLELLTASDVGRLPWGALVDPDTGTTVTVMLDGVRQAPPMVPAPSTAEPVASVELPVVAEPPVVDDPSVDEPSSPAGAPRAEEAPVAVAPPADESPADAPPAATVPPTEPLTAGAESAAPEFVPVVEFEPLTDAVAEPDPPAPDPVVEPEPEPAQVAEPEPARVVHPQPDPGSTPARVVAPPATVATPALPPAPPPGLSRSRLGPMLGIAAAAVLVVGVAAVVITSIINGAGGGEAGRTDGPDVTTSSSAPPTTSSPPDPISVSLDIQAAVAWTDTTVRCEPGLTLSITASGTVLHEDNPASTVTPDGLLDEIYHQYNVDGLPTANTVALIGRLDEQQPFVVGSAKTYDCPAAGALWLGINDIGLVGNSGAWQVVITSVE